MPKLFLAIKAFIVKDGKVLILRESDKYKEGTNVGRFDVPGGRLTPGERWDEALLREVKEETGLSVNIKGPISVGEWRPVVKDEEWQVVGIFFECAASSDNVVLGEDHDCYEWIDPKEYVNYNLIPNLKPIFEAFLKN